MKKISIRWTIGDVSNSGFEILRLSVWGAWKLFGESAFYTICVNSVDLNYAINSTGDLPETVTWYNSNSSIPEIFSDKLHTNMADGVAWKFAPFSIHPELHELSLDNDCILWGIPSAINKWLKHNNSYSVFAEDTQPCFGQFSEYCGTEGRNTGIRGIPPDFNLEEAIKSILLEKPVVLNEECDEQGLQIAALSRVTEVLMVTTDEVSICSPFPYHQQFFGKCGVHFVGINAKWLPWDYYGIPAADLIQENWYKMKNYVYEKLNLNAANIPQIFI